jgi:transcription factor MBP1
MRRKADSWMNATQILKVADFDKPQRTRILEREVQKGVHEKVQGGYGKYQGYSSRMTDFRDLGTL